MTRAMFFKMLVAFDYLVANNPRFAPPQDVQRLPYTPPPEFPPQQPACKQGEERCPLGHCQKPDYFEIRWKVIPNKTVEDAKNCARNPKNTIDGNFGCERSSAFGIADGRLCSTCGIVYVK